MIGHPGTGVDAVGDRGQRQLLFGQFRPEIFPHASRHFAMQLADAIGVAGQLDGQYRHAEALLRVFRILAPQTDEIVPRQTEHPIIAGEKFIEQFGSKMIDTGFHRGVGGENVAGTDDFPRLSEIDPTLFHQEPDPLQGQESGVAFIHVADVGDDPQCPQSTNPADPEQDLLDHAHFLVTEVQLCRDQTILGTV